MAFSMDVEVEEKARLSGHRWQLSDLAFNVDGTMLASASWDKEVRLWDLFTLDTVCTLKDQHSVPVTTISWFPPDGSLIATGSSDCTACLWSVEAGEMLVCLKEHFGWVMDSSFSENGAALATASWDKTVRVWDPATGSLMTTLNGHTKGVYSCHFHPSATATVICSASEDETVRVWDTRMQGNKPMRTMIGGHDDAVTCCRWSPDGNLIATGGADHTVTIWDAREAKVISQLQEHSDAIKSVAFHPGTGPFTGKTMLASAGDTACCLWDPAELAERDLLFRHTVHGTKDCEAIAFTPDGTVLATGGRDNDIVLSFLSVPGQKTGEEELVWVKRQNEDRARQQELEDQMLLEEERENQQQSGVGLSDDSLDSDDTTDEEEDEFEDPLRRRKWPGSSQEQPAEVQRRQLRKTPAGRRSSAMVMSQLRRRSIYGDSGGSKTPNLLRSTMSAGMGSQGEDSAYGLRQLRLLKRAAEIQTGVTYLGNAVTEHGGNASEDDDVAEEEETIPASTGNSSMLNTGLSSSNIADIPVVAIGVASGDTTTEGYQKTKTILLGQLPETTPGLAMSMPASRTNSIQNFFAGHDPLPDRPSSTVISESTVLEELDSIIADEDEEDDDDDLPNFYGQQFEYVAEPIRPPPEYLERKRNEEERKKLADEEASALERVGSMTSPTVQPRPTNTLPRDAEQRPPTQSRPTSTLPCDAEQPSPTQSGPTSTLSRDAEQPPPTQRRPTSTLSRDAEQPPPTQSRPTCTLPRDAEQPPPTQRRPTSTLSTRTRAQRQREKSRASGATEDSSDGENYESMSSDEREGYEDVEEAASARPAPPPVASKTSTLNSQDSAGPPHSRTGSISGSRSDGQQSPGVSRSPSINSQSNYSMAGRRLPIPPPNPLAVPAAGGAVSPLSVGSVCNTPPTTPKSARANSSRSGSASGSGGNSRSGSTSGGENHSPRGEKPIVPSRPTVSSRSAAPLPPKTSSRSPMPYLDSLVEENNKTHSLPGSPATGARREPPPGVRTPPPVARRPTTTLPRADKPPLQPPQSEPTFVQEDYMAFAEEQPAAAQSYVSTAQDDYDDDDQRDEYLMLDPNNETSVI